MQNRDIRDSFNKIAPDENAKSRMLYNIANPKKKKRRITAYAAIGLTAAACLLFLLTPLISNNSTIAPHDCDITADASSPPIYTPTVIAGNLPMLDIEENYGGMGFEGYMAYDIAELDNGNPWTPDANITVMPVYRNPIVYDGTGFPLENMLTADDMLELARSTAEKLGLAVESEQVYPSAEDIERMAEKGATDIRNTQAYEATVNCGEFSVSVGSTGDVTLRFNYEDDRLIYQGLTPPAEYVPEPPDEYTMQKYPDSEEEYFRTTEQQLEYSETTRKNAEAVMPYLLDKYKTFVDLEEPKSALFGDYNIYAWRHFYYSAYEGKGSIEEQIVNYSFNTVYFEPSAEGHLYVITRSKTDLSNKIGDYPIITADAARKLLLEGRYVTTVPEEFPGGEYVAKVELMYRSSRYDSTFFPYYRFLVELPNVPKWSGLKNFGAYYVPAVEEKYISNMPKWEGQFN